MSKITGPRSDSPAHRVICRLVDLGGNATTSKLMEVLGAEHRSFVRFQIRVTEVLQQYRFIMVYEGRFVATDLGKAYVANFEERKLPVATKYVGKIAPPRVAQEPQPLNLSKHLATLPMRAGAFDHQQIPSLMGGSTVIINGKSVVVGEQRVLPRDRTSA